MPTLRKIKQTIYGQQGCLQRCRLLNEGHTGDFWMDHNTPVELQLLLDRFRDDPVSARAEILDRATERLRRLATKMLCESFPAVRSQHDLDSVVNESWLRLRQALSVTEPATVKDFFRLAAHKIRHVLLDMVMQQRQAEARTVPSEMTPGHEVNDSTYNPERLSAWTTFHEQVSLLPDEQRDVFEMHYYLEVSQADIALAMDLPPRQVSRLWVSAIDQLRRDCQQLIGIL